MLKEASDYARARARDLTAADIIDGQITPVWSAGARPDRLRSRLRLAVPIGAVALSVALVIGLVLVMGGGGHIRQGGTKPSQKSPPVIGQLGGRSVLLLSTAEGSFEVVSPVTGAVLGKVTVDWSGNPFPLDDPLVAASSNEVFVGGFEGHGGWIIVAAPLSGRAPARLVAVTPGGSSLDALAVSPGGQRLAWIVSGGSVGSGQLVIEDVATGKKTAVMLDRLLPAALTGSIPVISWAPDGERLALAAGQYSLRVQPNRLTSALIVFDAVSGRHSSVHLSRTAEQAIGPNASGVVWSSTGLDLYVANQRCLLDEKCLDFEGAPLAEIDASNGELVRTFSSFQSVSSVSINQTTGDLAVAGEEEQSPHLRPTNVDYLSVLGGEPVQSLTTFTLHQQVAVQWIPASALGASSAADGRDVTVPLVVGESVAKADAVLELAGLRVRLEPVRAATPPGTVVALFPIGNVRAGSVETLRYAVEKS
jgi:hypothetical protein